MSWKNTGFSIATALGLVVDQVTKAWARSAPTLQTGDGWAVSETFLHLVHRENTGAAFSLLSTLPDRWRVGLFIAFNLCAAVLGLWLVTTTHDTRWGRAVGIGLFVAGAVGNGIDRLTHGSVTDFIRVHADLEPVTSVLLAVFGRADGPVFNIADVMLITGVVVVVVSDVLHDRRHAKETPHAAP